MYDNASAIMISKKSILHVHTKHTEIEHYFIHDNVENGDIELMHINKKHQIVDIFTKTVFTQQHGELRFKLGMLELLQ
jgi:hypothetical protein